MSRMERVRLALGMITTDQYLEGEWQRFMAMKIAELHKQLGDRGIELMFSEVSLTPSDDERYTTDEDRYQRPVDTRRSE